MSSGVCVCVSGFAGTPGYLSPEVLRKDPYGKPVDIWACGESDFGALNLLQSAVVGSKHPLAMFVFSQVQKHNWKWIYFFE